MAANRDAVAKVLESLRRAGTVVDTIDEALGELALTLAQALDEGAGMATAAVSRELRATLSALTTKEVEIDEQDPIFGADLPAPVRHDEES